MMVSRREICAGLLAGGVVVLAGAGGTAFLLQPGFDRILTADLLALLPDVRAAAKIGGIWLGRHGALAASWNALPRRIETRLAQSGWQGGNIDALRAQVAGIVQADFVTGAIEDVDGWRISRFQAELCGLACLDASRPRVG